MRDLSSLTREEPVPPAVEAHSLNHWTAREVPRLTQFLSEDILVRECLQESE